MAFHAPEGEGDALIATINTTPLVDVMLVLLIIFLITIPVVTATVPVELPRERVEAREPRPDAVVISVDRMGTVYWGDQALEAATLAARLATLAALDPQPEVQVRGDLAGAYSGVGRVLQACRRAGVSRVALITEPPPLGS